MTAFWSALSSATEDDIDGFKYLKLPTGEFPLDSASVKDKLLVRKSYVDVSQLATEYFAQKASDGRQLAYLIFILRGNPGEPCRM